MKTMIIEALRSWINQRPGLEYANYGSPSAYRSEVRSIGQDLKHARELLAAVAWRDGITDKDLIDASRRAFSGRLTIDTSSGVSIDYCTGQYWPTEYRRAAAAVLAAALREYWRRSTNSASAEARRSLSRSVIRNYFT
jgi:hypothetical protein